MSVQAPEPKSALKFQLKQARAYGLMARHPTYKLTTMSAHWKGTSNSVIYYGCAASDKNVAHSRLVVCICLFHPNSEPELDGHASDYEVLQVLRPALVTASLFPRACAANMLILLVTR